MHGPAKPVFSGSANGDLVGCRRSDPLNSLWKTAADVFGKNAGVCSIPAWIEIMDDSRSCDGSDRAGSDVHKRTVERLGISPTGAWNAVRRWHHWGVLRTFRLEQGIVVGGHADLSLKRLAR